MTDVPRETSAPPAPAWASELIPEDRLGLARTYVDLLAGAGVTRGLIGPREVPRLWERHVLNCAAMAPLLGPAASVCDVGTGAGLPGLVLAIGRPDLEVTLVEPLLRRTTFLEEAVGLLGLERVRVVRARAEELHGESAFSVVTARAVAPLPRLAGWCLPLVEPTGRLLAMKGASAVAEAQEAAVDLDRRGARVAGVHTLGGPHLDPLTTVVEVVWKDPTGLSWPLRGSDRGRVRRDRGGSRPDRRARSGARKGRRDS